MATQVAFSDLNTWLGNQPANTADTPYEITVTGLTVSDIGNSTTSGTLGNVLRSNNTKYVDLSTTKIPSDASNITSAFYSCASLVKAPIIPVGVLYMSSTFEECTSLKTPPEIPDGVIVLAGTFQRCTALTAAPVIPNSVVSLSAAFENCTSLVLSPKIPDGVSNISSAFYGCSALVGVYPMPNSITDMSYTFYNCSRLQFKPIIPSGVIQDTDCFYGVLTQDWCGTKTQINNFYATLSQQSGTFRINVFKSDRITYDGLVYGVDISELSTWLATQQTISPRFAVKVLITNLTTSNVSDIKTALTANPTKYVDLSYTSIPSGSNCDNLFENCTSLTITAVLPSPTSLVSTYKGCTNLQKSPTVPNTVTNMTSTFEGCTSLTKLERQGITQSGIAIYHGTNYATSGKLLSAPPPTVGSVNYDFSQNLEDTVIDDKTFENYYYKASDGYTLSTDVDISDSGLTKYYCGDTSNKTMFGGRVYLLHNIQGYQSREYILLWQSDNTQTEIKEVNIRYVFNDNGSIYIYPQDIYNDITTIYDSNNTNITQDVFPADSNGAYIGSRVLSVGEEIRTVTSSYSEMLWEVVANDVILQITNGIDYVNDKNVLPTSVTTLSSTFEGCSALTESPIIPSSVTNMSGTFSECTSLVQPPVIPNGVTTLSYCFEYCTNLETIPDIPASVTDISLAFLVCTKASNTPTIYGNSLLNMEGSFDNTAIVTAPVIPDSVTNMNVAFMSCQNLKTVPNVPSSVTKLNRTFVGCSNLEVIESFEVPLSTLKNNSDCIYTFAQCPKLKQIGYKSEPASKWHVYFLTIDSSTLSVSGKVYSVNDNNQIVTTVIPSTSLPQFIDTIRLPILTDELWFPTNADNIEATINNMLAYKYGVFNTQVVPPDDKYLILWADEDGQGNAKVITNIGGGGGVEIDIVSASKAITPTGDKREIIDTASVVLTLNAGATNGVAVEVYALAASSVTYYTDTTTTATLSMASGTRAVFMYFNGWKYSGTYGAVWN